MQAPSFAPSVAHRVRQLLVPVRLALAALLAILSLGDSAKAEEIVWHFESTFVDGATVTGVFVVDLDLDPSQQLLYWDVATEAGTMSEGEYYVGYQGHDGSFGQSFVSTSYSYLDGNSNWHSRDIEISLLQGWPEQPGALTATAQETDFWLDYGNPDFPIPVLDIRDSGPFELIGESLSDFAPDDIYSEGGRLDEVAQAADPVDLVTGAFTYNALLLQGTDSTNPFQFELFYDSEEDPAGYASVGRNWRHSYDWRLGGEEEQQQVTVIRGDRAADYFDYYFDAAGNVTIVPAFPQSRATLAYDPVADLITYTTPKGIQYIFDNDQGWLRSIVDRNGNALTLDYDPTTGWLSSVTEPAPAFRQAMFSYDQVGFITAVDYASGLLHVDLTYDGPNLTSFSSSTNPNLTTRFEYDYVGRMLTGAVETSPADGMTFVRNTYDGQGRVISQVDAMDGETRFAYEDLGETGRRTTVTDPVGNVSVRTFDDQSRIVSAVNNGGESFSWEYDEDGNLIRTTGPLGTRQMSYSDTGELIGMMNENQDPLTFDWQCGKLMGITDGNQKPLAYEYDPKGNLTRFRSQCGCETRHEHDGQGRLKKTIEPTGRTTENIYNALGQLERVSTPTGNIQYGYDAMGRLTSVTDQNGHTRTMAFDENGALALERDATGMETRITNDVFGRSIKEERADGATIEFVRDSKGNITTTIDAAGNRHQYGYDALGRLTSRTDPGGAVTRFFLNANGDVERTLDALGGTASATYSQGEKSTVTDPNGNVTRFSWDTLGRTTSEQDPLGRTNRTSYDHAGGISQVVNARGQQTDLEYDDAGRLVRVQLPDDTVNYTLDLAGRRTSSGHSAGATLVGFNDALNRVESRTDEFGNVIQYAYDAVGNLTRLTYSDGLAVTYTYDAQNRMTAVEDWAGRRTTYAYDSGGNVQRMGLPDGSAVTYQFDLCGRMTAMSDTAADGAGIFSGQWTYDACGRTRSAALVLPLQPALAPGTTDIAVDAANQIQSVNGVGFSYDADGNLTSGAIGGVPTTLVYDSQNRLRQRNGDVYRYDVDGLRIQTTRDGVTTRQVWDGTASNLRLLEEHDANGAIIARYVHGLGLIGRDSAAVGGLSVYHYDKRGSTVALVGPGGNITDRYAYGPYGEVLNREGSTANPFTYNGRDGVFDDGTGLYYTRLRYYVPSLGRFAQKEAVYRGSIADPQSLNAYAYVNGNPIDGIDPTGEWGWSFGSAFAGAIVGGVSQVVSNAIEGKPAFDGIAGAVVEGAVTGALIGLGPVGVVAASAGASVLGSAVNAGVNLANGDPANFDLADVALDAAVAGATAGVVGKLFPGGGPTSALKNQLPGALAPARKAALQGTFKSGLKDLAGTVRDEAASLAISTSLKTGVGYAGDALSTDDVVAGVVQRTEESGEVRVRQNVSGAWGLALPVSSYDSYMTGGVGGFRLAAPVCR